LQNYLDLIRLNQNRFIWKGQHLDINNDANRLAKIRVDRQKIIDAMDEKISELARNRKILEGRIISSMQREELNVNQSEIEAYQKSKQGSLLILRKLCDCLKNKQKYCEKFKFY